MHLENNICVCDDSGQYIDTDETCQNCNTTLDFCLRCQSATECIDCETGIDRHLENGTCQCDEGFFEDDQKVCQSCEQVGCLRCIDATNCTDCNASDHWTLNDTSCQCMQ